MKIIYKIKKNLWKYQEFGFMLHYIYRKVNMVYIANNNYNKIKHIYKL